MSDRLNIEFELEEKCLPKSLGDQSLKDNFNFKEMKKITEKKIKKGPINKKNHKTLVNRKVKYNFKNLK